MQKSREYIILSGMIRGLPSGKFFVLSACIVFPCLATTITKVVDHGPDSNRIVFAVVGDGYTQAEQEIYNADADSVLAGFREFEPWKTYYSFVNFYRINITSIESGIGDGKSKNTAFGSYLYSSTSNTFNTDLQRIQDTLNKYLPKIWNSAFLLANESSNKGFAVPQISLACFTRAKPKLAALHESGHSFGGLADEYVIPGFGTPSEADEPNVALPPDTGRETVKWKHWLTPGVPIPTPGEPVYVKSVGVFAGAKYTMQCYRPEYGCMMGGASGGFCRICNEALTLKIHELTHSAEASPPSGTVYYNVYPISCTVAPLDPLNISHKVRWYLDYSPLDSNVTSLTLQPWDLGQMPHILQAVVTDTTHYDYWQQDTNFIIAHDIPFVKYDPKGFMSDTLTWNLQYQLDGPNAVYSTELIAYSVNGRSVSIRDKKAWELYSQRNLKIYDVQGKLLETFSSNGIVTHNWQAPSAGVFFIRLNDVQTQTKRIVIR